MAQSAVSEVNLEEVMKSPLGTPRVKKDPAALEAEKAERFKQIGGRRISTILRAINLLGNCANTSTYGFTPEQVASAFQAIGQTLAETEKKFQPKTRQKFDSNFFGD